MIPCADPRASYQAHRAEIDEAIAAVLESGRYILGDAVRAFEMEFARYIGAQHAIGVGSGTEALHVALRACGVGAGDEVITVSHTAVATVAAIELCSAVPVLVDIEPDHYTIDVAAVERAITPRTRAVVAVHLYGQPADLGPLVEMARDRGVRLVEDCAQAHGACYGGRRVGSFGDVAAFSFYPTKNLGAFGDGGLVTTDDDEIADRARGLRQYGWRERYVSAAPGWNSRLDELQAAILRVKLRYLDEDNARRASLAQLYDELLADTSVTRPRVREGSRHVYHLYVVRSPQRDALIGHLAEAGVQALIHYPVAVHDQPAYRGRIRHGALGVTESIAREVLSLPMFPELPEDGVRAAAKAIATFAA